VIQEEGYIKAKRLRAELLYLVTDVTQHSTMVHYVDENPKH